MEVLHDAAARRFRVPLDEGEGYVEYAERGPDTFELYHTVVPPAERGQGIGSSVVQHVLEYAREHGYRIVPSCPFVRSWLAEHPEYQDLVSSRSG
jgi:predicted GNAT family acetyltransferase